MKIAKKPEPPLESTLAEEAAEVRANLIHLGIEPSSLGSAIEDRIFDAYLKLIKTDGEIPSCAKVAGVLTLAPSTVQLRCQRMARDGRMLRVISHKGYPAYIPKVVNA